MISPLKRVLPDFKKIEVLIYSAIAARFGIPCHIDPIVKEVDVRMVATERLTLMSPEPAPWPGFSGKEILPGLIIEPLPPRFAKKQFLNQFSDLYCGE